MRNGTNSGRHILLVEVVMLMVFIHKHLLKILEFEAKVISSFCGAFCWELILGMS